MTAYRPPILMLWNQASGEYEPTEAPLCTSRWASSGSSPNGEYHGEGDICSRVGTDRIGDSDVCEHHLKRARDWIREETKVAAGADLARLNELDAERRRLQRESAREARELREAEEAAEIARSCVYYVQRESDGLIKIGTSRRLSQRMATLRSEHGPITLLLTHPGGHRREGILHGAFLDIRMEGEWFRPEPHLLAWIQKVEKGCDDIDRGVWAIRAARLRAS